jgi:hypothetical protein
MFRITARNQFANVSDFMTVSAPIMATALGKIVLKTNQIARTISPSLAANDLACEWNVDPAQLIEVVEA